MDEGTLQVEHEGHTYHARWVHNKSGVVQVWVGDRGPFSTIIGTRGPNQARRLALLNGP